MITAKTTLCAVIGDPVGHSVSPVMHNAGYATLNLPYVYTAFSVKPALLGEALQSMKALGIRSFSVTLPHKQTVLPFLDVVDPIAKKIGAVNTIINEDGRLTGYNTDWEGAMRMLEEQTPLKGKKVVVLGAGGAARGVVYGLVQRNARDIVVVNRTIERAKELAEDFSVRFDDMQTIGDHLSNADILFNTTTIGMTPHADESPVKKADLRPQLLVADAVFNPWKTKLLREAEEVGCHVALGYRMLLWQGVVQFELATGEKAPVAAMDAAVMEALQKKA